MPQIIQYIDAIARQKQRDVLYLVFGERTVRAYMHEASAEDDADSGIFDVLHEWERTPNRQMVLDWLDEQGMAWQPCGGLLMLIVCGLIWGLFMWMCLMTRLCLSTKS
jgi:hypothetical protein